MRFAHVSRKLKFGQYSAGCADPSQPSAFANMPQSLDPFAPSADSADTASLLIELVDHLDAMLAYWDSKQVCRFANMAYKDWFGRGRNELLGTTLRELLGPLYEANLPYIEAAYRGERQVFERAIPRPDGSGVRHSLATYIPRVVGGHVVGMFVHVADIEPIKRLEFELRAARDEAQKLATHDFLTGLPNRLLLHDRAIEAIARAKRTGDKVYLLTIDVDNFKLVNDSYGHPAGDQLLIDIAGRIKSCVRDYDTVARIGGDEFVVLTTGGPLQEGIEALATRMLESARQPAQIGGRY
ncbi:GGDEF domain-containing protein [Paucibacter sp. O1-1]|nr:GGDEF domain-containing protein [Paucibacter sp. O1-1]MDA3830130.1 GGDEF domain-containing protein [Paucibacter sp. O1-1]